ncbi:MAG: sorbosone dehydrogenase family protein [Phycisphaerales bacterium]
MYACMMGVFLSVVQPQPEPRVLPERPPGATEVIKPDAENFVVRRGYRVSAAVEEIPAARFLECDDRGTLYVSRPDRGDIIALRDNDGDGVYETRADFVTGKPSVHGMSFHDGWLWFATSGSIHRARDTNGDNTADEVMDVIPIGSLPMKGAHWWRSLVVTDDGLFTSIGDGANISDQRDTERQKIWKYSLDGSGKTMFASGIRNNEKLRFRPGTKELWGFDHGSDNFAGVIGPAPGAQAITDLNPPDEFNLYTPGGFYGHPFLVGDRIPRPEYINRPDLPELAAQTTPPEFSIPAHWAVNGFTFIDPEVNQKTKGFPADHAGDAFIAAHGSWNSSRLVGYCVARVLFDEGKPYGLLKIVSTIDASSGLVWARPVDCVQAPDGSILFSSDAPTGRVFRIRYVGEAADAPK